MTDMNFKTLSTGNDAVILTVLMSIPTKGSDCNGPIVFSGAIGTPMS